ncbi:MAG: hypothetical protein HYX97_02985 [Chloroflexi bacterium]|nr:hypothetical protein [Chloroflexota bacterium]
MEQKRHIWKVALGGAAVMGLTVILACSGGASQAELDAAKAQTAAEQQKTAALQQLVSNKDTQVNDLQQKLSAKEKEAAELQKKAEAAAAAPSGLPAGGTILLAAKPVPSPTPRPTPTPLPAGFTPPTPPPPPVPPASFSQPLALYIHADTVTSGQNESKYNIDATGIAAPLCVQTSVFKRGMHLVWRWEIVDTATGKRLTSDDIETAVVRLPSGEEIKGRFGRHGTGRPGGDGGPWFWTAAWDVPLDYPLGALDWSINAKSKDGKTGTFALWYLSIPERGIEARTQIIN